MVSGINGELTLAASPELIFICKNEFEVQTRLQFSCLAIVFC